MFGGEKYINNCINKYIEKLTRQIHEQKKYNQSSRRLGPVVRSLGIINREMQKISVLEYWIIDSNGNIILKNDKNGNFNILKKVKKLLISTQTYYS